MARQYVADKATQDQIARDTTTMLAALLGLDETVKQAQNAQAGAELARDASKVAASDSEKSAAKSQASESKSFEYAQKAELALTRNPKIVGNTWHTWDAAQGKYVDTGVSATEPGPQGPTPVRGVDYWTQADQEAIKQDVITQLKNADNTQY